MDEKPTAATAINHDHYSKLQSIAVGDIDVTIRSLGAIFKARKEVAKLLLQDGTAESAAEYLEYLNYVTAALRGWY